MKPFHKTVTPKHNPKESEDSDKSPRTIPTDKVDTMVRGVYHFEGPVIQNWTECYLERMEYGRVQKYYIDRYYPELKLALDKFYTKTDFSSGGTEFKRGVLNSKGIRYMVLTPEVSFEEALIVADTQKVK